MPAQSVQPMIEPSGNICGGTSSFVPAGDGCGCGSTGPSGNICGGTSSYVPAGGCGCGGSCGSCGGGTVPSGNICGGTSNFTPAGDSCRCSSCISKRMHRGGSNKFPGVRRVGTDLGDLRGRNFIPTPPATDKRREMLPNGGGVVQIIPTRTAEPVKAQGTATPAMIPAATTKPTDLGGGPAPTPTAVMAEGKKEDLGGGPADKVAMNLAGQDLVRWTAPDYCSDDRLAATELCRQGGDQQLSDICRQELRAWIASGDKTPLAQWVNSRELCSGELSRLLGLVEKVKTSAGLWPVYGASGAPMSLIQPMRFANPSKPSFVPGMGMARASGGMYRPSGLTPAEGGNAGASDWTIDGRSATDYNPETGEATGRSGNKSDGGSTGPSTTDYIRSIGGVATAALEGISRTIGQQADIRLRQLMASNADTANARAEANRTLQIELDAGIRRAQVAAQGAGSERLAQLQTEIAAMREASTRSATLAQTNAPPSTPLVSPTTNTDEGLSTGAKVGIGVGAVAVLGLGAFLVMRRKR
jgi:hypothetical protein